MNTITIKIDEDNDIYEMAISTREIDGRKATQIYTLDNVYESKYSYLFDELNMAIEAKLNNYYK